MALPVALPKARPASVLPLPSVTPFVAAMVVVTVGAVPPMAGCAPASAGHVRPETAAKDTPGAPCPMRRCPASSTSPPV